MTPFINTWRTIGWNGLTLSCPEKWETIVSGKRHLLFEEDFAPIFELRWQNNNKSSADSILRNLQKQTGLRRQEHISTNWPQLDKLYEIIPLTAEQSNEQRGLFSPVDSVEPASFSIFFMLILCSILSYSRFFLP